MPVVWFELFPRNASAERLARLLVTAETTWLWDPVSDRLVAVMRAGASFNASDPNGNVVRQFIHGDMGYDDPLEVTAFNASTSKVDHLYPIFNEAAGGELQAVINGNGELVARSINTDPYGSAEFDINGAAVDQVSISAKKTSTGAVDSVTIRMRSTEQISASTVASGARLAVVDGAGTLLRTSATAPALDPNDPFTIVWTVPASEWASLTDSAPVTVNGTSHTPSALSIAARTTLRAAVWSASVPFQPPPDWAKATRRVTSSAALPFEDRESLTSVTSLASGATDTRTVYDIPSLSLIGTTTTSPWIRTLFASTFQAHPFAEPMNGKNYVRARWYDPVTGTWLTPDPLGYGASGSNLYSLAHADPVNRRDPTGMDDDDIDARQDPSLAPYYEDAARLREEPEKVRNARAAGRNAAVRDQVVGTSIALTPGSTMVRIGTHALRVLHAGRKGGFRAAAGQAWREYVDELSAVCQYLPACGKGF